MNSKYNGCCSGWAPWTVGVLGSLLVVGGLVWLMIVYTRPAGPTEDRVALRHKNLREVRAAETEALASYAWIDQGKGIVRLPIERAIELTVREWADPAAARAELITRIEKATAKPPEPKSEFE